VKLRDFVAPFLHRWEKLPHLIIDGYNYINRIIPSSTRSIASLDILRRTVLERFARYKREKGIKITVVFDAYKGISLGRQRENYKGIDVVYSREKETADEVIIGWIREKRSGLVVVSSDREIIDEAKHHGITFITPLKLAEIMAERDGTRDDKDSEEEYQKQKGGNPRKLPKRVKRAIKTVGKI
jgi:predicted RNA-binding protein with PIN domain